MRRASPWCSPGCGCSATEASGDRAPASGRAGQRRSAGAARAGSGAVQGRPDLCRCQGRRGDRRLPARHRRGGERARSAVRPDRATCAWARRAGSTAAAVSLARARPNWSTSPRPAGPRRPSPRWSPIFPMRPRRWASRWPASSARTICAASCSPSTIATSGSAWRARRSIRPTPPRSGWVRRPTSRRARVLGGHIAEGEFEIDTGSNTAIEFWRPFARAGFGDELGARAVGLGVAGESVTARGRIDRLEVAGRTIAAPQVNFADETRADDAGLRYGGVIGGPAWGGLVLTLDLPRRRMWVR